MLASFDAWRGLLSLLGWLVCACHDDHGASLPCPRFIVGGEVKLAGGAPSRPAGW